MKKKKEPSKTISSVYFSYSCINIIVLVFNMFSFFVGKIIAENEFKFAFLWESNDIILAYLIIINKHVALTANFL